MMKSICRSALLCVSVVVLHAGTSRASCSLSITNPSSVSTVTVSSVSLQGTVSSNALGGSLLWTNALNGSSGSISASASWSISSVPLALGTNAITVTGQEQIAPAIIAIDRGTNSAYSSSWTNNSNGGSGFNAWSLSTTAGNSANGGFFMGSGSAVKIGTKAWGMYANSGYSSQGIRTFTNKLEVGQTFRARMQNNWIQNGGGVGIALQNGSGSNLWQFWFIGGESSYRMTDQAATGIGWTGDGFDISVVLTGTNSFSATITKVGGSPTNFTGTLGGGASSRDITRVRLWNSNAGSGSEYNAYFNDIDIQSASSTGDSCSSSISVIREQAPPVLRINEISSSNRETLRDEDGDNSDWIEIINAGTESVDLNGYGLTDNLGSPYKWTFPSVTLETGKCVLVWASSKNRRPDDNFLTNGLRRDLWYNLYGETVSTLTNNARYPLRPDNRMLVLDMFETAAGEGINFGQRLHGYVVAPSTGNYRFYIASDDYSVLLLSTNSDPKNAVPVASVPGWTDSRQWDKYSQQQSAQIPLVGGQVYYISAIMKQGTGGENLAVGWQLPNASFERPIPGNRIFHRPDLHANFSISAGGEPLRLTSPGGVTLDETAAVPLTVDISYGRANNSTSVWHYFDKDGATPGYPNSTSGYPEVVSAPVFSVAGGFYTSSVSVGVSSTSGSVVIRYTLDGSEPTASSPVYTNAITMSSRAGQANQYANIQTSNGDSTFEENWVNPGEVFKLNVLRARAFKTNALPSLITTRSYVIHPSGANRFSMPVISIATTPSNLFGSTTGIYVPGTYENYTQSGRAWERKGHLEFYEDDGSLGFVADVGLRINGNMSRRHPRKSLRVYSRALQGDNEFSYQLFPDKNVNVFDTFILRNGGNDWAQSIMRDSLMAKLVAHTGVDHLSTRPAIVFIDGEYWGVHDIRDRIDEGYFANHYGLDELEYTQLDIHHHTDAWKHLPIYDTGNPSPAMTNDFLDILNRAGNNEFSSSGSYTTLNSRIDVDNYIDYNIYEIFAGNTDWPGNNARVWRAVTPNTSPSAHPRHDGRWRWMFFDTDLGLGLPYSYNPGYNSDVALHAAHNTLDYATATNNFSFGNSLNATVLLRKSLENPVFRSKFVNRFADLLNSSLATNRTLAVYDSLKNQYAPEMTEHKNRWNYPTGWSGSVQRIHSYLSVRPGYVWGHLRDKFGLSFPVALTVNVTNDAEGSVTVNSLQINSNTVGVTGTYPWSGEYFSEHAVTLTATPKPGYRFVEWVAVTSSVSVQAADEANSYSSWTNNSNLGSGFAAWSLQTTSGNSGQNGHFLAGGSPKRWGLYANSSQEANAYRNLSSSMVSGQTFRARFGHGYIDTGASVGIALQNSSGQPLWELYFGGGGSHYTINGSSSGIPFTTQGIDVEVTLTGTSNYAAKIRAGGSVYTFTGNLQNQANKTISRFRAWNYNAGSENNLLVQNLSVVTKTQSAPASYSTNQTITVSLAGDAEFKAVFEEIPPEPESELIHYWNFNNTGSLLSPSYTVGGAIWTITNGPTTEVTSGTGQDFFGENARNGDAASSHLRVNNPIGATMTIKLPTTGYEDIIVMYESRRSGSGAGSQIVDYSLDGTNYSNYTTVSPVDGTPVIYTLDFSSVSGADDNPNFIVRVTYAQGGGGTVGNNRFDNFTVEGVALPLPNMPPVVVENPGLLFLIENDGATVIDLTEVFDDPNNDPLTYIAQSDNTNVLLAGISGSDLVLAPELRGQATITVTADDGENDPAEVTFRTLVYPEPQILEIGAASFTQWLTNQAAGTYPQNMIFLQGVENDSTITSKLEYAYHIPVADAAATNDANYPYAAASRTRMNGLGTNGVSSINTGRGRDLGASLMAIDTLNISGASVTWTGGTVTPNVRVYAVRLQYRVGTEGEFQNVLNGTNVVEYVRNASAGHSQVIGPIALPAEAIGEEYVQLLWRYYLVSGSSGARAELRVDDILVEADE